jgi:AraC-like DNA-binding protein
VIKGTLTVYIDDNTVIASDGDIVFVSQEIVHGYQANDCVYEVINFDANALFLRTTLCKSAMHIFANNSIRILPFCKEKHADLYAITNRLFRLAAQNDERQDLLLLSALFELIGAIYAQHHYTENFKASQSATRFKPLLDFIDSSYMNPITSADMAKTSGMSLNHFGKVFSEYFGKTPIEFLTTYRIERACVLLINTTISITDIACSCGFYDSSYFVKVFKKYKGITPKKYRTTFTADN